MATEQMTKKTADSHLNDLYWNSDHTVDDIVEQEGIGRNTLYSAIAPLSAEARCPTCRGDLEYTNRTNRSASIATCEKCGMETTISAASEQSSDGPTARRSRREAIGEWSERSFDAFGSGDRKRAAVIGGVAAVGAMIGAAALRSLRD